METLAALTASVWPPLAIVAALSSSLALVVVSLRKRRHRVRPESVAQRTASLLAAGASPHVADALARGQTILAIKIYREERGEGLRASKEAIERLARTLDHIP